MKSLKPNYRTAALAILLAASNAAAWAQAALAVGQTRGAAIAHTAASRPEVMAGAQVALPGAITPSATVFVGKWRDMPANLKASKVPVVVLLHGSSGLGLKAIEEWQRWLADMGVASVAPDSFALADRLVYQSPVANKAIYEQIHALRASEIALSVSALQSTPWADMTRLGLAGTSEGSVAVARYTGPEFAARMLYAWSCEDNYFVEAHRTAIPLDQPFLNVISTVDPFFSSVNTWLGAAAAPRGHCGDPARAYKNATVVLIGNAPHTLLGLATARSATAEFVRQTLLKP
jgi:dienelactone hydrolase